MKAFFAFHLSLYLKKKLKTSGNSLKRDRHRQDLNLCLQRRADFQSAALTTRPRCHTANFQKFREGKEGKDLYANEHKSRIKSPPIPANRKHQLIAWRKSKKFPLFMVPLAEQQRNLPSYSFPNSTSLKSKVCLESNVFFSFYFFLFCQ